jgi:glycosyl transferase family 25
LGKGEIGCALSHREIYREIVRREIPWSVVLEDDIRFDPDAFAAIVRRSGALPAPCEILLLGHHSCNGRNLPTSTAFRCAVPLHPGHHAAAILEGGCGTYGYMISLKGARRLLEEMERIARPADHYTGRPEGARVWAVVSPVVRIDSSLDRLGTIEPERRRKRGGGGWKEALLRRRLFARLYRWRHHLLSLLRGIRTPCRRIRKGGR